MKGWSLSQCGLGKTITKVEKISHTDLTNTFGHGKTTEAKIKIKINPNSAQAKKKNKKKQAQNSIFLTLETYHCDTKPPLFACFLKGNYFSRNSLPKLQRF